MAEKTTKATAKAVAAKDDELEEQRERRAEILATATEEDLASQKEEIAQAKKDKAPFVPKLDDAGAREQQRAALELEKDVGKQLEDEGLTGPPVVAPIVEPSKATIKLSQFTEGTGEWDDVDDNVRMDELSGLFIQGEGFSVGEAIIDVRREDVGDHARMSTMTDVNGDFMVQLGLVTGPGTWLIHGESLVTVVGEGREDHLPLVLETKPIDLEVTA